MLACTPNRALRRPHPWSSLLLCLIAWGCYEDDWLDGTWRQPKDSPGEGSLSYELVLGQFGSDVSGLVRLYERLELAAGSGNLYGAEQYCRPLEHGRLVGDQLGFQAKDSTGRLWSYALDGDQEQLRLAGVVHTEDGESRPLVLERISDEVARDCSWIGELVIQAVHDGELQGVTARATVLYLGSDGSTPCAISAGDSTAHDPGAHSLFTLTVGRKPPECWAIHRPHEVTLAWGIFVLFDDLNDNGHWDRDPLPGGVDEPVLAFSTDRVLLYLDGELQRAGPALSEMVGSPLPQGFSFCAIETDSEGIVQTITPLDLGSSSPATVDLRPADAPGLYAPRLDLR